MTSVLSLYHDGLGEPRTAEAVRVLKAAGVAYTTLDIRTMPDDAPLRKLATPTFFLDGNYVGATGSFEDLIGFLGAQGAALCRYSVGEVRLRLDTPTARPPVTERPVASTFDIYADLGIGEHVHLHSDEVLPVRTGLSILVAQDHYARVMPSPEGANAGIRVLTDGFEHGAWTEVKIAMACVGAPVRINHRDRIAKVIVGRVAPAPVLIEKAGR